VKVSWDDDIPNCFWKVIQNSMVPVTTNQIAIFHDIPGTANWVTCGYRPGVSSQARVVPRPPWIASRLLPWKPSPKKKQKTGVGNCPILGILDITL